MPAVCNLDRAKANRRANCLLADIHGRKRTTPKVADVRRRPSGLLNIRRFLAVGRMTSRFIRARSADEYHPSPRRRQESHVFSSRDVR